MFDSEPVKLLPFWPDSGKWKAGHWHVAVDDDRDDCDVVKLFK